MSNRNAENSSLSEVLKQFIEKNKLDKGLDKINVREAWENQMGPAIKNYTHSIELRNHTLHIKLNSSVLREELSYGKEKIINNLNDYLGEDIIKKLILN
ncbi:hypothetical protein GGR32_001877 [Mesonia hippocampi]|uniref:RNA-binding protein n=1 Tax=Mesonia hippocampi TaxID=1628250 RepID=A0A840ER97_9FLAO|nr:DUF721 domain-containing protein [Mesonia hippocampi]MBB4119575.1 hypothetical protein [Mesonia hippocampi]